MIRGGGADAMGVRVNGKRTAPRHVSMPSCMSVVIFNPSRSTSDATDQIVPVAGRNLLPERLCTTMGSASVTDRA